MSEELKKLLIDGSSRLGVEISEEQAEKFLRYLSLLKEWNQKMNLTAIEDDREIVIRHFLDSLSIVPLLRNDGAKTLLDIGTGAGFPGVPVKICFPELDVTLMDSLNKRLLFLDEVISELGLSGIRTVHSRAEDAGKNKDFRENFDAVTARAVASMPVLAEYGLPFVRTGGYFYAMKSKKSDEEIELAKNAINILGGEISRKMEYKLPYDNIEYLVVVIKKLRHTPTAYPRKAGKPTKEPLV